MPTLLLTFAFGVSVGIFAMWVFLRLVVLYLKKKGWKLIDPAKSRETP